MEGLYIHRDVPLETGNWRRGGVGWLTNAASGWDTYDPEHDAEHAKGPVDANLGNQLVGGNAHDGSAKATAAENDTSG